MAEPQRNIFWYVTFGILMSRLVSDLATELYRLYYFGSDTVFEDIDDLIPPASLRRYMPHTMRTAWVALVTALLRGVILTYIACFGGIKRQWTKFRPQSHQDKVEYTSDVFCLYSAFFYFVVLQPLMDIQFLILYVDELLDELVKGFKYFVTYIVLLWFCRKTSEKRRKFLFFLPILLAVCPDVAFNFTDTTLLRVKRYNDSMKPADKGYPLIASLADEVGFRRDSIFVSETIESAENRGTGRHAAILLGSEMLDELTAEEVTAVVAHEFGHWYYKHNLIHVVIENVNQIIFIGLFYFGLSQKALHKSFGFNLERTPLGLAFLISGLWIDIIEIPFRWLLCGMGFIMEYQADEFAVRRGYGPSLITGLAKLYETSYNFMANFLLFLQHTHPSLSARVSAIRALIYK